MESGGRGYSRFIVLLFIVMVFSGVVVHGVDAVEPYAYRAQGSSSGAGNSQFKDPWGNTTDRAINPHGNGEGSFNFEINTTPPAIPPFVVDFSASPQSGNAPLAVAFTDQSTGNPTAWNWDFGDGTTSTDQHPLHLYSQPGLYDVSLTVWNTNSTGMVSKTDYISVFNVGIFETDTELYGLTITNCGGPQTIAVNTSILAAALNSGNSALVIQPPAGSGFKNITFYGNFLQGNNLITGNPASVHIESEDIAPPRGFSVDIGTHASFSYSIDLPSYPCNAKLTSTIREGVTPYYDTRFRQIASANDVFPVGTAYTATITKTNFPSGTPVKIFMSVNSSWRPSLYGDYIFIWRIADDESYGQILPTHYRYSDPVKNLDYYEADSPLGLSTIGISATTGNNNPFQILIFVVTNVLNQWNNEQRTSRSGSGTATFTESGSPNPDGTEGLPLQESEPVVQITPPVLTQPAMTTNIGMAGWLLAIIQKDPVILVAIIGIIALVGYFGWWKERL